MVVCVQVFLLCLMSFFVHFSFKLHLVWQYVTSKICKKGTCQCRVVSICASIDELFYCSQGHWQGQGQGHLSEKLLILNILHSLFQCSNVFSQRINFLFQFIWCFVAFWVKTKCFETMFVRSSKKGYKVAVFHLTLLGIYVYYRVRVSTNFSRACLCDCLSIGYNFELLEPDWSHFQQVGISLQHLV